MRKFLSPHFIGRQEPGLDNYAGPFDEVAEPVPENYETGSKDSINFINKAIRDFVARTVRTQEKPLVLSGDCLSAIGCLAGAQKSSLNVTLLWFDAHGDFHTPQTTISGHLGGMPLAMISGRGDSHLTTAVDLIPLLDTQIFLIGGRDLEEGEKQALQASGIHHGNRVVDLLPVLRADTLYWVHYDVDYLCPDNAPAMRYPAVGGIMAQEAKSDLQQLADTFNIAGISISAWAPHLDKGNYTAQICWDTLEPLVESNNLR